MLKVLPFLLTFFFITSCSKGLLDGDIQKNLKESDKIYGKCNNPNRQFTYLQKQICESKERAAGPDGEVGDGINITDVLDKFKNGNQNIVYGGMNVNSYLWNGSLAVLDQYPLKEVDSEGGFISTDWILEEKNPDQRCLIKVNITSTELISTGVKTKIICQNKTDEWYLSGENFINEENQITLKILELANELSSIDSLT
jgi:hypothetical protein|tara:strand:- start:100 stop:696 length:597 start_codon:yes stop_codon:yes gene_type:complete